jgi:hypothetical protein
MDRIIGNMKTLSKVHKKAVKETQKKILEIVDEWIPKKGTVAWRQSGYIQYWRVTDDMLNDLKQRIKFLEKRNGN